MKRTKKWLLAAAILLLCGLGLGIAGLVMNGFSFEKISLQDTVEKEETLDCPMTKVRINTDHVNVRIVPVEDNTIRVHYKGSATELVDAAAEGSVLRIDCVQDDEAIKHWFTQLFNFASADTLTLYIPTLRLLSLEITTRSGNITLEKGLHVFSVDLSAQSGSVNCLTDLKGKLSVTTGSGNISLRKMSANEISLHTASGNCALRKVRTGGDTFFVESTSGNIKLEECLADKSLWLKSTSGNIRLENCDAGAVKLQSTSGNIKGSLARPMIFAATTSSGQIRLPGNGPIGAPGCTIQTQSGSVTLTVTED